MVSANSGPEEEDDAAEVEGGWDRVGLGDMSISTSIDMSMNISVSGRGSSGSARSSCSIGEVRGEESAGHTLSMFSRGVRRWDSGHTGGYLGVREVSEATRMRSTTGRHVDTRLVLSRADGCDIVSHQ